jgi:hypothetical protein
VVKCVVLWGKERVWRYEWAVHKDILI